MSVRVSVVGLAVLAAAVTVSGQGTGPASSSSFRYERAVLPGDRGPNRLPLDAQILAGGRSFRVVGGRAEDGLSDLRLYDASGREVPYLLVPPAAPDPAPLRAPLPFERRASEPGASRYRLALPGPRLPLVAIEIATSTGNVLREARVTEARLTGGEVVPFTLGSAVLRRAVRGGLAAAELRIPIEAPTEPQVELTVADGSNPPLALTAVEAVFADLPWIYFEAETATPLLARYGRADLPPPRYDLEVARAAVDSLRLAIAEFGPVREAVPTTRASEARQLPPTGATIDLESFRVSREIPSGPVGLQALSLDAAVLAHAARPGLGDIRIATTSGQQIPYVIERLDEPLSVALPPLAPTAPPGGAAVANPRMPGTRSYYQLLLPYASLPRARLVFETTARVFDRELFVMSEPRESDARRASVTRSIAGRRWVHANPETPAPPLVVDIDPPDSRNVLVVVDEGDNQALPLSPPRLLLPSHRLRFFRASQAPCLLLYGRKDLAPPRYDLTLLAAQLVGAPAHEIVPGPEVEGSPAGARMTSPALFWIVLVLAALVLLVVITRLVRHAQ